MRILVECPTLPDVVRVFVGSEDWLSKENDAINEDTFNSKNLGKIYKQDLCKFINVTLENYRNFFIDVDENESVVLEEFIADIVEAYPDVCELKLVDGNSTALIVCVGET